jgi:sugar/nucleoside kinase (ribokinase family)
VLPRLAGGVLCAGNIVYDILVRPVDRIAWNTSTWVDSVETHMGGNGASTSYTLARLGVPVRLLSVIGSDAFGDELLARLRGAGVDISGVARSQSPTATTVGLVNSQGDRLFLHRVGAGSEAFARPVEWTPALLEGSAHFHLANAFALPNLRRRAPEMLRSAVTAGLSTSVDTGWDALGRWMEDLGPCLPHVHLLFVNEDEARHFTGANTAGAAARELRRLGACNVVVKLGGAGCAVITEQSEIHVAAFDVPVVDTTGAGDCFAGAFLAALGRGRSAGEAGRFANAVAAMAIRHLGATGGVRSYAETEAWMTGAPIRGQAGRNPDV